MIIWTMPFPAVLHSAAESSVYTDVVTSLTECVAKCTSLHPSVPFRRLNIRPGALGPPRFL
jgi:hypothetical protein